MARYSFTNNPDGDLLADVTAAGTMLTLATGHGARFPTLAAGESFPLTVQDAAGMEIMLCTARTGDVLTVTRAQEGSTARAFTAGAAVQARITAAVLSQMVQEGGDTMTGALHLPAGNPSLATEAAHKGYVDGRIAAVPPAGISQADADTRYVNATGDSMTGTLTLPDGSATLPGVNFASNANLGIYRSANHAMSFTANSGARMTITNAIITVTNPLRNTGTTLAAPAYSFTSDTDSGLHLIAADQMSLVVGGVDRVNMTPTTVTFAQIPTLPATNPTLPEHAARKAYVDSQDLLGVLKAGDTMTGALTLSGMPVQPPHAANRQYVDQQDALTVLKAGDTMTGALTLPGDPVNPLEAATRQFVLSNVSSGSISEAPSDGAAYGRRNIAWDKTVRTAGDTMTGALLIPDGTGALPSLALASVPGTGMARGSGSGWGISTAGIQRVEVGTTQVTSTLVLRGPAGSAGFPAFSFTADTNTGMWSSVADVLGFATGGVDRLNIGAAGVATFSQTPVIPAANPTIGTQVTHKNYVDAAAEGLPPPTIGWDAAALVLPAGWTWVRPDPGTYVDAAGVTQTAAANVPRFTYDRTTRALLGLLVEDNSSNLLLNSAVLATQSVTTTAVAHTLSFVGAGTVDLTGTHTASVVGTGATARKTYSFTPTAGTLTVTVTGDVREGQIETKDFATSWIPTTAAAGVRGREYFNITGVMSNSTLTWAMRLAPYREGSALGAATNVYAIQWGASYAANNSARMTKNANGTLNFIRQPTGAADYNFNTVRTLVPDQFNTIVHGYGGGTAMTAIDTDAVIEVACGATGWPVGPVDALRIGQATVASLSFVLSSFRLWNGTRLTNAQASLVAANKGVIGYVDAQDALRVARAGDTMTGMLTLPASNPTLSEHAVRKAYADSLLLAKMIPLSAVWGGSNYDPVSEAQFITVSLPARTRYVVTWVTSNAANGGGVQATMTIKASLLNAVGAVVGTPLGFLMRSVGGTYASTTFPVLFDCGVGAVGASTAWTVKISAVRDNPFNMLEQYLAGFAMCEP